ncbi:hypothetical protein [Microvirga zambiensis]|uniref:hypothetical protein n=1 Tax=Microvirga zambiensis TaxID=1402137 RepID=UPI00191E5A68|nr:hypothetical protein [Microvirga zambiensis]
MTYCARYRFKILSAVQIPDGEALTITVPGLLPATLEIGLDAYPFGKWAVLRMSGFATEEEARIAGRRLGDTLLVTGAVTRMGIDIGFSRSTLQFSAAIHAAVKAESGKELRAETHGLMVYEEDAVAILGMNAQGSVLIAPQVLEDRLTTWVAASAGLTERQRNCAALLNDSFFVPQTEGQFVLRVSAVEALCDQTDVGADYQTAISAIEAFVASQAFADDVRETINRSLSFQRRQSLRQSYMTKFRTLLSETEAKAFDALYQKRSKLVHDGQGRGDLTMAANEALDLAAAILAADLTHQPAAANAVAQPDRAPF